MLSRRLLSRHATRAAQAVGVVGAQRLVNAWRTGAVAPVRGAHMQAAPLLVSNLVRHAAEQHKDARIISYADEGRVEYGYDDAYRRSKELAVSLKALGVGRGDVVGTIAMNHHRHLEAFYGVQGSGSILHTVNPRLSIDHMSYIINHAEDQWVMIDPAFLPLAKALTPLCKGVKGWIVMANTEHMPEDTDGLNVLCYESLLSGEAVAARDYEFPRDLDENAAVGICYTSGTTGLPKGVAYSGRSKVLHAYSSLSTEGLGLETRDRVLTITPQFHVSAWGIPESAAAAGASLILPGMDLSGAHIESILRNDLPTLSLAVPSVWQIFFTHLATSGVDLEELRGASTLERVVIGGSAVSEGIISQFHDILGATTLHAWGMTETSPIGTICNLLPKHASLPWEERKKLMLSQGRPVFGVEMRLRDDQGNVLPHDGKHQGHLEVRGPWVVDKYYKSDEGASDDGWFDTGDAATVDADGYMRIVDRKKDVIKSGGEWVSSVELENTAASHDAVLMAAAVGLPHSKWDERPLLLVVKHEGAELSEEEVIDHMRDHFAKWQLPDAVHFVDELPLTATGKVWKMKIREKYLEDGFRFPDDQ